MIALDMSWIAVIAGSFYRTSLAPLLTKQPLLLPIVVFYVFYVTGLIYFALIPALKERSFTRAVLNGAMLGFTANMMYDLINLAYLANWPVLLTFVDIGWGVLLAGTTAGLVYLIATKVFKM